MALGQPKPPAEVNQNPYLPPGPPPLSCEMFEGMNTQSNRAGVDDKQCYWIDGFFPYAPRKLRTMPGIGPALYTSSSPSIVFFKAANLGNVPILVVIFSDGSIVQVRTDTGAAKTIATAGTILTPGQLTVDINQWGSQYVLIVSTQINGYFLWDGNTLYQSGTLGPVVTITNVGAGYSSVPIVLITGGHGTGAVIIPTILNGQVTSASFANPGSGYLSGDPVSLTFSGGTTQGTGATLTAVLTHQTGGSGATIVVTSMVPNNQYFSVGGVSVVAGGSGYSPPPITSVSASGGSGPVYGQAQIELFVTGGIITGTGLLSGGLYSGTTPPTLTVSDPGGYIVSSVTVNSVGSGYSPTTKVTASGGGGPVSQANLSPVINAGTITSVAVLSGGLYGSNTPPTLAVTDVSVTATATVVLMPFAIQGSAIETYSGQVWIVNGAVRLTSAPGSVTDFATNDGGLNVTATDSYLKVGYTALLNTNGFLWLVGDSSVSYISGVQTSGTPPTTTVTYQNADPEVGTIWPNTVEEWGNSLLIANPWGVHIGTGSKMTKVSDMLDGIYNSAASFTLAPSLDEISDSTRSLTLFPSFAKANLFNKKIGCLLLPIKDPVSGAQVNKLLVWDGKKWWATSQDVTLTFIATQEINSVLTAWGTDGTHIYPLFQAPSTAFIKTFQTKLWDTPGYVFDKATARVWGITKYNSTSAPNLTVSIDNEVNAEPYAVPASTYTITGPAVRGYFVTPPQAVGQQGVLIGMTWKTTAADMEFVAVAMDDQIAGYRG